MSAAKHLPSSAPTGGAFVAHGTTVWTPDGRIQIGKCASPQLCEAGNAANARKLAHGSEALDLLAELVWKLEAGEACEAEFDASVALLQRAGIARVPRRGATAEILKGNTDLQVAA